MDSLQCEPFLNEYVYDVLVCKRPARHAWFLAGVQEDYVLAEPVVRVPGGRVSHFKFMTAV